MSSWTLIYCLFSFKFEIAGEVRIDDILVAIFAMAAFWFFVVKQKGDYRDFAVRAIYLFLAFAAVNIISTIYNSLIGRIDLFRGLLFSLRHVEYFVFVFLGYMASYYRFNFRFWLTAYLYFVVLLIPLQYLDLLPVFSGFSPDRAIANTGGPWELAIVSSFLVFFFLTSRHRVLAVASFLVLFLTGSRVTLVATVIAGWLDLSRTLTWSRLVVFSFLITFLALFGYLGGLMLSDGPVSSILGDSNVFDRIATFFSRETLTDIQSITGLDLAVENSAQYMNLTFGDTTDINLDAAEGDRSALVRFTNWMILINSSLSSLDSIVLGLGPSFAGKAVDGGFVRLLIESGLLGLMFFVSFIFTAAITSRSRLIYSYSLVILISAIFIDAFTTYKVMFLFWISYGSSLYYNSSRQLTRARDW